MENNKYELFVQPFCDRRSDKQCSETKDTVSRVYGTPRNIEIDMDTEAFTVYLKLFAYLFLTSRIILNLLYKSSMCLDLFEIAKVAYYHQRPS